ncbi:MAG: amidohydrolase [Planctomycetota bacterium]
MTMSSDTPHASHGKMNADILRAIDQTIDDLHDESIRIRRYLHANPEASEHEFETTKFVANQLREMTLTPKIYANDLGVTADIDLGGTSGQVVALRAELDCVGVDDEKVVDYRSTNEGLCHACGHDAHMTIVMTAAKAIQMHASALREHGMRCNIRPLFQPAEETAKGAESMVEQSAVRDASAIFAVHVDPFLEVGRLGMRVGPMTSSSQMFEARIRGRSGHTARPFEAVDPIPAATSLVGLFYQLGPRSKDPRYPLALTVAAMHAGTAYNAIPDTAIIGGTIRAMRQVDLDRVMERMRSVARGVSEATGTRVELDFQRFVPPTMNDGSLVELMARVGTDLLGPAAVQTIDVASIGAEDFAFFQQVVPGAIIRLGAAMPQPHERRGLHNSHFDIDEKALAIGAKVMARSAVLAAAQ